MTIKLTALTRLLLTEGDIAEAEKQGKYKSILHDTDYWKSMAAGGLVLALDTMKFLLNKRSPEVSDPGCWGVFGGTLNANETPKKAMLRELMEESGLKGGDPFDGGYTNGAHGVYPLLTYRNLDAGCVYYNFLVVIDKQFQPTLNWESSGAEWFSYGEWPNPLHPGLDCLFNDKTSMDTVRYHMEQGQRQNILKPRIQSQSRNSR